MRATMPYTISFDEASKLGPQVRDILLQLPAGHDGRQRARPPRRRHRSDRLLQRRVLRRPEAVRRPGVERVDPHQAGADRRHSAEAEGVSRHHLQLHAAGRGRGRRSGDRPQELAGGEDLRRPTWRRSKSKAEAVQQRHRDGAGHHQHHARARARAAEPDDRAGSREDRALRPERRRHQRADRDGRRRRAGDAGDPGRALVRSGRPPAGAVSGRTWTRSRTS